jgi:CDP-2,3-bis-(O-geranylgeranyl)-sn-glycerol synthase
LRACRINRFLNIDALLLLAVANSTPVLLSMLLGNKWARSIDAGQTLRDGRPVFGSHKTWRGFLGGAILAGATSALLSIPFTDGAAFGMLALSGDLLSSFIKRRIGYRSGRDSMLLDQLPEALLPMLVLRQRLGLGYTAILGTAALFALLGLFAARIFTYRRAPSR